MLQSVSGVLKEPRAAGQPCRDHTTEQKQARMVRSRGLEPPRVAPLAPQASASTNSATTAVGVNGRPALTTRRPKLHVSNRSRTDKASRPSAPAPATRQS